MADHRVHWVVDLAGDGRRASDVAVLLARRLQSRVVVDERLSHARGVVDPLGPRRAPPRVRDADGARGAVAVDLLDLGPSPAALVVVELDRGARLDPAQAVTARTAGHGFSASRFSGLTPHCAPDGPGPAGRAGEKFPGGERG